MLYSNFAFKGISLSTAAFAKSPAILQCVLIFIKNATHKCELPSGENVSECLSLIVDRKEIAKHIIFDDEGVILQRIISFGDYMQGKSSLAKMYII